jgi:excisionase family DNA binding protein
MPSFPTDVQRIAWAAEYLEIGLSTAYRLAEAGQLPGAFKVGAQWRISVPAFMREVHGEGTRPMTEDQEFNGVGQRGTSAGGRL